MSFQWKADSPVVQFEQAVEFLAPDPDFESPSEVECECQEIVRATGTGEDAITCGRYAEGLCAYCGTGVCEKHNDPCYEKACRLHEGCRDAHAKETGHKLEIPPRFDGNLIDGLLGQVDQRLG